MNKIIKISAKIFGNAFLVGVAGIATGEAAYAHKKRCQTPNGYHLQQKAYNHWVNDTTANIIRIALTAILASGALVLCFA